MACQAGESSVGPVGFVDLTVLTQWAQRLLCAQIALALIAMVVGVLEYRLLLDFQNGAFSSLQQARVAGEQSDQWQAIIGGLQWLVVLASALCVSRWIYQANENVRSLGACGLRCTSAWAVGWYFVPVANLWKPYLAMREIAKCSSSPLAWHAESVSPLVAWWWGLLVSYVSLTSIAVYLSLYGEGITAKSFGSGLSLLADLLGIVLCIVLYFVLVQICRLQLKQSEFALIED